MRPIKFRAWMKHTTDNRWRWAYDKAEDRLLSSDGDLFNSDDERTWRNEYLEQWDKEHQESERFTIKYLMCEGEEFGIYLSGKNIISHSYEVLNVMQFTGLLDKNGKEIWEGDIIRWSDTNEPSDYGRPFEVKWEEQAWDEERFHTGFHLDYTGDQYEVLGNIWE